MKNLKNTPYFKYSNKTNIFFIAILLFVLFAFKTNVQAQILLQENFNTCDFPANTGWTVNAPVNNWQIMNPNAAQGSALQSRSIDGSCMLYFEGDSTGLNTPSWIIEMISPTFDASGADVVKLEADVHFKSVENDNRLVITVYTGTYYQEVYRFQGWWSNTGVFLNNYRHINVDLTPYINPNMRLRIEYKDGALSGGQSAVDNILITKRNNIISQNFNTCSLTSGWTTTADANGKTWKIGNDTYYAADNQNMTASCMAYFNHYAEYLSLYNDTTTTPPASTVKLISPAFDATLKSRTYLSVKAHLMPNCDTWRSDDKLNIYVIKNNVYYLIKTLDYDEFWCDTSYTKHYDNYYNIDEDISAYRDQNLRVAFEYTTGTGSDPNHGFQAGIDDFSVNGYGSMSDVCTRAQLLTVNAACTNYNNQNATFEYPTLKPSCADTAMAGLWFKFIAPSNGSVTITTQTNFNDIISLYSGTCGVFTEIACTNYNEFGFPDHTLKAGEVLRKTGLTAGTTYYIRISGRANTFGRSEGDLCISVTNAIATNTTPLNDNCSLATTLTFNGACQNGTIKNATLASGELLSSQNSLSRASAWYKFVAQGTEALITTDADFSDVITVFSGTSCTALTEKMTTPLGNQLKVTGLTNGQTYYVQITGVFATAEGNFCLKVGSVPTAPTNDECSNAITVALNTNECTLYSNVGATLTATETQASCDLLAEASIWFKFVAPSSGKVSLNTGADFSHIVSVYSGTCSALTEVACVVNPSKCENGTEVANLISGQTYYVRVASTRTQFGYNYGNVCLSISNAATLPLAVQVKAFLQGAFATNAMTTTLNTGNLVPQEQPYNTAPWNYNGSQCTFEQLPTNVVDWVLIELRNGNNMNTVVARKAAFILTNGLITNANEGVQTNTVTFDGVPAGNYYIVVRHRNHVAVISSNAVALPNASAYDFTASTSNVYGGANQLAPLATGMYGLFVGDMNGNGIIDVSDYNKYGTTPSGINIYQPQDLNLDKMISVSDYNKYVPNASRIGVPAIRY